MHSAMKYNILILTDNNRKTLKYMLSLKENFENQISDNKLEVTHRVIYKESYRTIEEAQSRLRELENYTRMQAERLIRRSNPNWLNLQMRPSLQSPTWVGTHYQPGAKFNPKVPNRTSERWKGMA